MAGTDKKFEISETVLSTLVKQRGSTWNGLLQAGKPKLQAGKTKSVSKGLVTSV